MTIIKRMNEKKTLFLHNRITAMKMNKLMQHGKNIKNIQLTRKNGEIIYGM